MIVSITKPLSPDDVATFFSGAVALSTVNMLRNHHLEKVLALNFLWLLWMCLVYWRAKVRRGRILGVEAGAYYFVAIATYFVIFLLTSLWYLVYAGG